MIKQYFDVSNLIDVYENFDDLRKSYLEISESELGFRGDPVTSKDALLDTIDAAICVGSRGKYKKDEYPSYVRGTRDIVTHVFNGKYNMEYAYQAAPKVIYMAVCILTDHPFEKVVKAMAYRDAGLSQKSMQHLKLFRRIRTNGYEYLVLADRLLQEYGEQTDLKDDLC